MQSKAFSVICAESIPTQGGFWETGRKRCDSISISLKSSLFSKSRPIAHRPAHEIWLLDTSAQTPHSPPSPKACNHFLRFPLQAKPSETPRQAVAAVWLAAFLINLPGWEKRSLSGLLSRGPSFIPKQLNEPGGAR